MHLWSSWSGAWFGPLCHLGISNLVARSYIVNIDQINIDSVHLLN